MTIDEEFQVLYERELPNVFRAVLLLCGDRGIAEDAAQEAFARALARWRRLGGQPWVGGWVMTTALNVARRQLRPRPPPAPVPAPDHDPESLMDARAAIRTLPPRQQEAVALHYLLDLPVADTAVVMGCDEGTVKTHLSRARSTLRTALAIDDEPTDQRSTRLAEDTLLRDRVREAAAAQPPPRDLSGVARRARVLRARRAAAAVIVGCVAAAGVAAPLLQLSELGSPKQPAASAPVLTFESADGWHVRTTEVAETDGAQAWAANVPYAPDEEPIGPAGFYPEGWPDKTIAGLPPDGVVIVATYPLNTRNAVPVSRDFPRRTLPLELDRAPASNFEGQDPGTSMAVVNATVNGRYVSVRLMFGAEEPAASVVAEAEAELGRLVVAPPPSVTTELDDFGIRMSVPQDWSRVLFAWGLSDGATLYAGTVPWDFAQGSSVPSLGSDDLFVILAESAAFQDRFQPVTLPIELGPEDVCPPCEIMDGGKSPPADHTLFVRTFSVGDRRFSLYAEFGTPDVTDDALAELNGVLASLMIDAHGSLGPTDPGAEPHTLPAGPSFTATEPTAFDYEGLSLQVPTGWTAVGAPISEPAVAPVVAAFGSWPFPTGGGCGPEPALAALPADAAFVWLVDHPMPGNRGDFYAPSGRFRIDLQTQPGRWECGASWPSRMELWQVGGRFLEVHVALGPAASQVRVAEVEDLVNSLSVP